MLHPDFPVVVDTLSLPRDWSLFLPVPCNHRIETEDMVLWRPGLRIWLSVWGSTGGGPEWVESDIPGDAQAVERSQDGPICRISYRVNERERQTLYAFVFGPECEVQLVAYCEGPPQIELAKQIVDSVGPARVVA